MRVEHTERHRIPSLQIVRVRVLVHTDLLLNLRWTAKEWSGINIELLQYTWWMITWKNDHSHLVLTDLLESTSDGSNLMNNNYITTVDISYFNLLCPNICKYWSTPGYLPIANYSTLRLHLFNPLNCEITIVYLTYLEPDSSRRMDIAFKSITRFTPKGRFILCRRPHRVEHISTFSVFPIAQRNSQQFYLPAACVWTYIARTHI